MGLSMRIDIRELKTWRWLLGAGFWTLLGLAFALQSYLSALQRGSPVGWSFAIRRSLADWYIFGVLSIPALWLARRCRLGRQTWPRNALIHLAAGVLFSLAWMALRSALEHYQIMGRVGRYPLVSFREAFMYALVATFFFNMLIYWAIVIVSHALSFYLEAREREVRAAELESRLAQARLQALQMQLNPHFLFNTLQAISTLMRKKVDAADRMLIRLSDLLRYALERTGDHEVPLKQELDFLGRYLEIEQIRFGERLEVKMDVQEGTLGATVPNLLLQPLVENAIRHGIEPNARPGKILLTARREGNTLELQVQDNGNGLPQTPSARKGVGVANVRARLEQLYGAEGSLEMKNGETGGLVVRVKIPWREGNTSVNR
jgi:two-component system, LytTR family, sensor kinase